jgi:glycosyltransferase involved in cell wall biosynthesis
MARVDVVVPAYNAAATISEAVRSLQAQTLSDIRIIIVDDGSADQTAAILNELAAADTRIHVVTQSNRGIVEARNEALRHCTAAYVACLDADDIAFPGRLERQVAYFDVHPECVALGGAVEHIDVTGADVIGAPQAAPPQNADLERAPALEPYIVQSTLMVRRADVEAIGGYRHVPNSEDADLYWRLSERGALINLPDVLGKYRVHVASASSSIVSGRAMAIGSQLGAISALRRRAGRPDLIFSFELLGELKSAETLVAMTEIGSRGLASDEAERLRLSAGAKLMEMALYRPYELDEGDCAFIRAALPSAERLNPRHQLDLRWYVTVTAARLLRKGLWREAAVLTPPKHYALAAARAFLQR